MRHLSGSSSESKECDDHDQMMDMNSHLNMNVTNMTHTSLPIIASKSQPTCKSKSRSVPRMTKRPPSERRFKCDQCERMFFTRKDVKRHMVVHTGIRNFACPFCTQRFGRKDHLVRHAKKSHNKDTRSSSKSSSQTLSTSQTPAQIQSVTAKSVNTQLIVPKNRIGQVSSQVQTNSNNNSTRNKVNSSIMFSNGNHNHMSLALSANNNSNSKLITNQATEANTQNYSNSNSNASLSSLSCHSIAPSNESFYIGIHNNNNNNSQLINANHHAVHNNGFNSIKSEVTPQCHQQLPMSVNHHHYLAFPVNSALNSYHAALNPTSAAFLPACFVSNSNGVSSSVPFGVNIGVGIPVSVHHEHHDHREHHENPPLMSSNPALTPVNVISTAFPSPSDSLIANPLPHFNQAFQ